MTQKFMIIAVAGYVFFAGLAAIVAVFSGDRLGWPRRFAIILLRSCAITVFVVGTLGDTLLDAWRLEPLPFVGTVTGVLMLLSGLLLMVSPVAVMPIVRGWWSPLPWLHGLVGATLVALWMGAYQGPVQSLFPDWRFISASAVLWLICLFVGDIALMLSHGARQTQPVDVTSRVYSELLRLCAAPPAILIYLMGFQL